MRRDRAGGWSGRKVLVAADGRKGASLRARTARLDEER